MMSTTPDHQLAIDIGNTAIKAAVFLAGKMMEPVFRFTDQEWEVADRLVTNHGVQNIIYSTVANVPPTKWIDKWNNAGCLILRLEPGLPLPFTSEYETMATLGQDRVAAVAGSLALPTLTAPASAPPPKKGGTVLPTAESRPVSPPAATQVARLIVDAGTCMTLDLIDGNYRYLGGNISPGLRMRLEAMHHFTARLPQPQPGPTPGVVGRSTEAALRHGAQMGLVYEVEGLYYRLLADYPDLQLLLTGGDGGWLSEKLSVPFSVYPNLVLRGLNQILSYYVQHES